MTQIIIQNFPLNKVISTIQDTFVIDFNTNQNHPVFDELIEYFEDKKIASQIQKSSEIDLLLSSIANKI